MSPAPLLSRPSLLRPKTMASGAAHRILASVLCVFALWRLYVWYSPYYSYYRAGSVPIYSDEDRNLPPLYPALKDRERTLPQHFPGRPESQGNQGRYLRFENELWGVGLNNQLQELFLNTYIAHLSNRSYVFTPIIWDLVDEPFIDTEIETHMAEPQYPVRPTRLPASAFLDAPTTGAAWAEGDDAPRSIYVEHWDEVCPESARLKLDTAVVNEALGIDLKNDEGRVIVRKWAEYLKGLDHGCVTLAWGSPRIIDFDLVGSDRLLSIWPEYSRSPVLTRFDWSPIVHEAVERNLHLIAPWRSRIHSVLYAREQDDPSVIPGLVTLHVRRTDFKHHCDWLSSWATFNAWNRLAFLPDRWMPPSEGGDARTRYAHARCWIEIPAIAERLDALRREHPDRNLERVYVATNGESSWIAELRRTLAERGWKNVATSRDLDLTWQQGGVSGAIDMEIASRGEIFVANGFSSMSSTVTRVRLVRGVPPQNTRFW